MTLPPLGGVHAHFAVGRAQPSSSGPRRGAAAVGVRVRADGHGDDFGHGRRSAGSGHSRRHGHGRQRSHQRCARPRSATAQGNFLVTNLQPGQYTLRIALQSFRTLERKNIVLSAGERLAVANLTLEIGNVGETVTVESRGTYVNTAETQHSGLITAKQIEQIQVLGRDVTSIMRLLPGVRYENTVDSLGMSFGTSVPNVGGARRDWSNVITDGVVSNEVGNSGLMAQQINLDAIAEVRVLLNSYRAEYGRAGGGQVQIVTKSGSSNYFGNLYYYGRHEKLNANDFFNNRNNVKKPRYRFNTYGGNLGGPVPGTEQEAHVLLLDRSPAGQPARPGAELDHADRCRDARRLFADAERRGPAHFHQRSAGDRRLQRGDGRPGVFPRQHHPRQSHQLERPGAAEHAAARQHFRPHVHAGAVQLHDAGERREPEVEQHRAGGLAADGDATASTSRSRTGTRTSGAAKSPPGRRSGDSSTPTT